MGNTSNKGGAVQMRGLVHAVTSVTSHNNHVFTVLYGVDDSLIMNATTVDMNPDALSAADVLNTLNMIMGTVWPCSVYTLVLAGIYRGRRHDTALQS